MAELHGFINVLKPPGMTSHDVVSWLRRVLKTRAIGHAGTLDPAASGVLPVAVGKATRLLEYITDAEKQYIGEVTFGIATDTLDQEGSIVAYHPMPELTEQQVEAGMQTLRGNIWQKPPAFSAVKHAGKPLYEYARAGESVEVGARRVAIHQFDLLAFTPGPYPKCLIKVGCSKGTYIRVLALDLAKSIGGTGCLSFLLRSQVGRFTTETAVTLDEIERAQEAMRHSEFLLPLSLGVANMAAVELERVEATRFLQGQRLRRSDALSAEVVGVYWGKELLGVASIQEGVLAPRKVVAKGEELGLQ